MKKIKNFQIIELNKIKKKDLQQIQSDIESEFLEAKKQVKKIATFRLNEINKK